MKFPAIAIFLSIVLIIYSLISYYIYSKGYHGLEQFSKLRPIYTTIFIFFSLTYIIGRISVAYFNSPVSDFFIWIGSFWLGAIAYFFIASVSVDIIKLINKFLHFLPEINTKSYTAFKFYGLIFTISIVFIVIAIGSINARSPIIRKLNIYIDKKTSSSTLNIAMASDIHLGTIISSGRLNKLVSEINALNPDIVLFAGDIFDEDLKPVINKNLGEKLTQIKSKYGTFAVPGNHEYIGGINEAINYLESHNVKVLRDSAILINNDFYIVGRDDKQSERFKGKKRQALSQVCSNIDKTKPVILMDHQPFNLSDAVSEGCDLQLSGHTHHGQLWPFNFITKAIFEISSGYLKKNNTHFYVSTGFGTWGPPVRTGNRPEIVNIKVEFQK